MNQKGGRFGTHKNLRVVSLVAQLRPSFGTEVSVSGPVGGLNLELGFPGQYLMETTWYNWHREYMPDWGRYLQPDPIGLNAGTNMFQSVGANPLRYIDPDGLDIIIAARAGATMRSAPIPHVSSGTTDRGVLRGFRPKSELAAAGSLAKGIVGLDPTVPGELRRDIPQKLPIELVIPTSREQDLAYERCLDVYDDSRYSPLGRNCTDPVETCLREIGFDVTDSMLPVELVRQLRGYKKTRRGTRPPR